MLSEDMNTLVRSIGQGPTKIFLETLARGKQFKAAIETPIGIEILTDVVKTIKDKMELVINEEASKKDIAELRCYKEILNKWSERISKADSEQMRFNRIIEGK